MLDEFSGGGWGREWHLVDLRAEKARAPYTFFTPSKDELELLAPGDLLQVGISFGGPEDGVTDRLWVRLLGKHTGHWTGRLEGDTASFVSRGHGRLIEFQPYHVLALAECHVDDNAEEAAFLAPAHIDPRVLAKTAPIGRLSREPGSVAFLGPFPDTGWHVYAQDRPLLPQSEMLFAPIGLVLNIDDSMLRLLNAPYGAFIQRQNGAWELMRPAR